MEYVDFTGHQLHLEQLHYTQVFDMDIFLCAVVKFLWCIPN